MRSRANELTHWPEEFWRATTFERTSEIFTGSSVEAFLVEAFVDVLFTAFALEASYKCEEKS